MTAVAMTVVRAADDSKVTPGVLGFVVVALLGLATWLLIRSMTRQMKKIDIPPEGTPTDRPAGTSESGAEGGGAGGAAEGGTDTGGERGSAQR